MMSRRYFNEATPKLIERARQFARENMTELSRDILEFENGSEGEFPKLREMAEMLSFARPFQLDSARKIAIAEIIKENLFPPEICISEKTWKTLEKLDEHERESAKVNHEVK